jgi:hypothetical protein
MLAPMAGSSVVRLTFALSDARQRLWFAQHHAPGVQGADGRRTWEGRNRMKEEMDRQEDDTEGQARRLAADESEDDTEGHRRAGLAADESEDDTEGHRRR